MDRIKKTELLHGICVFKATSSKRIAVRVDDDMVKTVLLADGEHVNSALKPVKVHFAAFFSLRRQH